MNLFDVAVVAAVAGGAIFGMRRGLLQMVTSVVALGAAMYVASVYYTWAGTIATQQLGVAPALASVLGWAVVFLLIFVAVQTVGETMLRLLTMVNLGWADRLAGSALGAAAVAVLAGISVMMIAAVLPPNATLLRDSKLAPMLISYNQMLVRYIPPEARSEYESKRDVLLRYWVAESENAIARARQNPDGSPSPAH